jgi:hypothetical protein
MFRENHLEPNIPMNLWSSMDLDKKPWFPLIPLRTVTWNWTDRQWESNLDGLARPKALAPSNKNFTSCSRRRKFNIITKSDPSEQSILAERPTTSCFLDANSFCPARIHKSANWILTCHGIQTTDHAHSKKQFWRDSFRNRVGPPKRIAHIVKASASEGVIQRELQALLTESGTVCLRFLLPWNVPCPSLLCQLSSRLWHSH